MNSRALMLIMAALFQVHASPGFAAENPDVTLDSAAKVTVDLKRAHPAGVPQSITRKAGCIAVIPGLKGEPAASHGDGVAICKVNDVWTPPLFIDLKAAALGVKGGDLILYLTGDKAVAALKKGRLDLAAGLTLAAGTFESSFDLKNYDVVAYHNAGGTYAGVGIRSGSLKSDDGSNQEFYGAEIKPEEVLGGEMETSNESTASYIQDLSR